VLSLEPYDIGCEPSPSVTLEVLVQDGWSTFLLFYAVSKDKDESGFLKDLGVAVLQCVGCESAIFGYPNDSGIVEHPLYKFGLRESPSRVLEVVDSPWIRDFEKQSEDSPWGFDPAKVPVSKHFIIPLKEKTFECIATGLEVKRYFRTHGGAFRYVRRELKQH